MIAGFLAILVHLSIGLLILTWDLASDPSPRFGPAGLAEAMTVDLVAGRPAAVVTNRPGNSALPNRERSRSPSNHQDAVTTQEIQELATPAPSPALESKESTLLSPEETSPTPSLRPEPGGLSNSGFGRGGSGQSFAGSGASQQTGSLGGFVESRPPAYGDRHEPEYPEIARRCGYQGTALLRVRVLEDGRVAAVQIRESSGYQILDATASKAVWTWRFTPALAAGRPLASWVLVPITFRLQ
jgi:protein TonB